MPTRPLFRIATRPLTAFSVACAVLASACGSNQADVPQGLLDAIGKQGGGDYPAGPYGSHVGETISDLCFDGWSDPKAEHYDPAHLDHICLGDFHDDPGARLLLVESCAIWCASCQSEYGGNGASQPSLAERLATRAAKGFRVLGTIFQDGQSKPATPEDAAAWASTYGLEFPFAVDADYEVGLLTSSAVAPFNVLIDTRTMKIVLELQGNEPGVLFSAADDFLSSAKAP